MAATTFRIKKHGPTFRVSSFPTADPGSEVEVQRIYSNFHSATDKVLEMALAAVPKQVFETAPIPGEPGAKFKQPLFAQDYLGTDGA